MQTHDGGAPFLATTIDIAKIREVAISAQDRRNIERLHSHQRRNSLQYTATSRPITSLCYTGSLQYPRFMVSAYWLSRHLSAFCAPDVASGASQRRVRLFQCLRNIGISKLDFEIRQSLPCPLLMRQLPYSESQWPAHLLSRSEPMPLAHRLLRYWNPFLTISTSSKTYS